MPERYQRLLALAAAVVSTPLLAALMALVVLGSRGRPLHVASRVGGHGQPIKIYKLRTMRVGAAGRGPAISLAADERVTRVGRFLRRTHLDELPQLWQVVRGEMRLVGPRPEDPRFVDLRDPLHERVFQAKPGITGLTQLAFAREADELDPGDPEADYRTRILPLKLALDERYLQARSARLDLWILGQTVRAAAGRPPSRARIDERLVAASAAARNGSA